MIHIWLSNPHAPLRIWQDTSQSWQIAENWQEIATLINLQNPKDKSACLYFPSMYVLHTKPALASNQLKALGDSGRRYLFEDISIASIDDLQVKQTEQNHLYALHRSDGDTWVQSASLAGVSVVALLPDFLLLNALLADDHTPSFYQDKTTQLLLIDNSFGTAVTDIGLTYHELKQQDTTIDKLNLTGQIGEKTLQTLDLLTDLTYESQKTLPKPIANPTRHALNFAIVKQQSKFPPYLKVISAVAIFAIVLSFVIDGLRIYHYQKATLQTKEQIKLQYNQWFPNETFNNRLNIERLLSGKLINQTGDTTGSNVLTVMTSIQPVLQQHQITAKQLNFQNNQLQLQLIAQNNDSLNQAINALNTQGIQAKLGTITPSEQGALAVVEITLA